MLYTLTQEYKEECMRKKVKEDMYISLIQTKLAKGKSIEIIAQEIELSVEEVRKYIDSMEKKL